MDSETMEAREEEGDESFADPVELVSPHSAAETGEPDEDELRDDGDGDAGLEEQDTEHERDDGLEDSFVDGRSFTANENPKAKTTGEIATIFVSGLPADAYPRELKNLTRFLPGFQGCMLNQKSGRGGLSGFVKFDCRENAANAIEQLKTADFLDDGVAGLKVEIAKRELELRLKRDSDKRRAALAPRPVRRDSPVGRRRYNDEYLGRRDERRDDRREDRSRDNRRDLGRDYKSRDDVRDYKPRDDRRDEPRSFRSERADDRSWQQPSYDERDRRPRHDAGRAPSPSRDPRAWNDRGSRPSDERYDIRERDRRATKEPPRDPPRDSYRESYHNEERRVEYSSRDVRSRDVNDVEERDYKRRRAEYDNNDVRNQSELIDTICVRGIPKDATQDEMEAIFSKYPGYRLVKMNYKPTTSMAFVKFFSHSEAVEVVRATDGYLMRNERLRLRVELAKRSYQI